MEGMHASLVTCMWWCVVVRGYPTAECMLLPPHTHIHAHAWWCTTPKDSQRKTAHLPMHACMHAHMPPPPTCSSSRATRVCMAPSSRPPTTPKKYACMHMSGCYVCSTKCCAQYSFVHGPTHHATHMLVHPSSLAMLERMQCVTGFMSIHASRTGI